MIRTLLIALILVSGSSLLSWYQVGYPTAGKAYIAKHRADRHTIRTGSAGYRYGSGSFRGGK